MDEVNFFGFGNRSVRNPVLADHDFYRVKQRQFTFHPLLGIALFRPVQARIGGLFKAVSGVEGTPVVAGMWVVGAAGHVEAGAGRSLDGSAPPLRWRPAV